MQNVIVLDEKLQGNYIEIGLLSKEDSKNYQFKLITNKNLTDELINKTLETISNSSVEAIKRVTKYKRKRLNQKEKRGMAIIGRYTLNGVKVRTDTLYVPNIHQKYFDNVDLLEKELKVLFGNDFEIVTISLR